MSFNRITELKVTGYLKELQDKWWPKCDQTQTKYLNDDSLTFDLMGGIFIVLGSGLCIALIYLIIQSISYKSFTSKKYESSKLKQENFQ